ncbi:hypothetical protein BU17DRAFT_68441 [Hysterangium stoloniferum]|nr:hypothetical protein BU17DRAFT_68441 [Hysterangium stoloniferum]
MAFASKWRDIIPGLCPLEEPPRAILARKKGYGLDALRNLENMMTASEKSRVDVQIILELIIISCKYSLLLIHQVAKQPTTENIPQTATNVTTNAIIDDTKANIPQEDSIDPATARRELERKLTNRPEKQELVDKNILKGMLSRDIRDPDSKVAPALQAAQAHLQRISWIRRYNTGPPRKISSRVEYFTACINTEMEGDEAPPSK